MQFLGLDLHKRAVEVCFLDKKGRVLLRHSVASERSALTAFAKEHLQYTDCLTVEATNNTWAVAEILKPFVGTISVGYPFTG
jgi:hypothetical protein